MSEIDVDISRSSSTFHKLIHRHLPTLSAVIDNNKIHRTEFIFPRLTCVLCQLTSLIAAQRKEKTTSIELII